MAELPGAAFISYVHADDQREGGKISEFQARLSGEVELQGADFPIFLDRDDSAGDQAWRTALPGTSGLATMLQVPIITPRFFRSPHCRDQVSRFLERERRLGREDLILPVYYISTPVMDDRAERDADELAKALDAHQYADWRELRFEPFTAPAVRKALAQLAGRLRDSLWRPPPTRQSIRPELHTTSHGVPGTAATDQSAPAGGPATTQREPTTGKVFISYRRGDTAHVAGRLADRIAERLGAAQVFMDVDSIEPGVDFTEAIVSAVESCDVFLALIGRHWANSQDEGDRRRLDNPDDIVVLEIEAALSRGVRLIPVLVDGAVMPSRDELPAALQPLVQRNALRLWHETFRDDASRLLQILERVLSSSRRGPRPQSQSATTPIGMDPDRKSENQVTPRVGQLFAGKVIKTTPFGAFVSLTPEKDGLVHISKLSKDGRRVRKVEDVIAVGETMRVMVSDIDARGKIALLPVWDDPVM